jgi:hypothetical protein
MRASANSQQAMLAMMCDSCPVLDGGKCETIEAIICEMMMHTTLLLCSIISRDHRFDEICYVSDDDDDDFFGNNRPSWL